MGLNNSTIVRADTMSPGWRALVVSVSVLSTILGAAVEARPDDADRGPRIGPRTAARGAAEVNRGVQLARRGAAAKALAAFERASRRSPDLPEAHLGRGLLLAQTGRHAEAQAALRQALALDPEMPEALEGIGLSLLVENRNREAAAAYARAIEFGASSADTHYNFALALARLGEREAAARACREAIGVQPGMARAQALLKAVER